MGFIAFLWNAFVRIVSFFLIIAVEIIIFGMIVTALSAAGLAIIAAPLTVLFTIWIIIDIILKIFIGGGKTIFHYIFKR